MDRKGGGGDVSGEVGRRACDERVTNRERRARRMVAGDMGTRIHDANSGTEVTPKGNVDPDAGEQRRELRPLTESEADAEYVTEAPAEDVASATIGEGSVRVGGVVSIRIVNGPAVAVFPVLSVAEQVNVCTPCVAIVTDPVASFLSLDKEKLTVPSVHAIAVAFESSWPSSWAVILPTTGDVTNQPFALGDGNVTEKVGGVMSASVKAVVAVPVPSVATTV